MLRGVGEMSVSDQFEERIEWTVLGCGRWGLRVH
jgi:hypothetical protein